MTNCTRCGAEIEWSANVNSSGKYYAIDCGTERPHTCRSQFQRASHVQIISEHERRRQSVQQKHPSARWYGGKWGCEDCGRNGDFFHMISKICTPAKKGKRAGGKKN